MAKGEELILIHEGTFIEIDSIQELLYQNSIVSITRDDYQSSMLAGWVSPASQQNLKLFVKQIDFLKAKHLIEKYLDDQNMHN